ncbi:rab-GTPase-TBC domain-containing protein [Hygrophoropsis aurantiaca]|uniref:Rab-GTPase-TBC domain-containing protein n=1 Tax=Hygrophoropsis aurantiaca TaxID=72124 RepID=A0ACB8AU27_9AGAM|nr:rab-GTPase-TBC domain-containing protein [Hygrophoropsis aurantiaca]
MSVHDTVIRQPGKGLDHRFNFDDAFSDGEDGDEVLEFNSAAIRKHLAENYSWAPEDSENREEEENTEEEVSTEHDTSVSTFNLDGGLPESHPRSPSPSTPPEFDSPPDFSQISLSEDPRVSAEILPEDQLENIPEEDGTSFPAVHIDVSKPPSSRIVSNIESEAPGYNHDESNLALHRARTPSASTTPPAVDPTPAEPPLLSASTSSPLPKELPRNTMNHKPSRSAGPSVFQKVVSKTRPPFLPPKNRQEDKKHMADWETMMKLSRAAGEQIEEKRRKALQERRLARELKIEESIHIWEKEILPDWRVVNRNPALRRLWWNGIPTKLRASMWERAIGNALALSKDNYRACLSRAKRALSSGIFPAETLTLIEQDITTTLPALHIFHPSTGPLYQDLKDMLCAWVVSRADEGLGYANGAAKIAAMLLINMPAQQAFVVMRNLLERHCMRSFYGGIGTKDDVEAYYRIFDTLLADGMPKIYFNFKQHQISPAAYLPDWLIPLFLDHLPFEACARLWDVLLLEGDSFLFRAALAILAVLESRLFFPDRQELLELLEGKNKAAIEVAKRDGRTMDGGKYEIYGVDEETLWERIDSMDEWWRESTWKRLTQRELPDL